jgi:hypothetical protein
MKRALVAILAATLTVTFSGVIFAAEPAQDVVPGVEKNMEEMKKALERKMDEMKQMSEQKTDEMKQKQMDMPY